MHWLFSSLIELIVRGAHHAKLALEVIEGGGVVFDGHALVEEGAEVLCGVSIWLFASLCVFFDQLSIAVEVFIFSDLWVLALLNLGDEVWEQLLESLVNSESVVKHIQQSLLVILRWMFKSSSIEIVKLNISCVNCEVILFLGLCIFPSNFILEELLSLLLKDSPKIFVFLIVISLKLTDDFISNLEITKLKNVRSLSLFLNGFELSLKGFSA